MSAESMDDLVARVVGWHNRHPLARRIGPAQVQGVGVVMLPFFGPGSAVQAPLAAAGTEAPAESQAPVPPVGLQRKSLRAAFSENFIAPLTPRRVARFALRHGLPEPPAQPAGPCREVLTDAALIDGGGSPTQLFLRTAAVEFGSRRIRVLLGDGATAAVIGPRLWSRPRAWGAGTAALLVIGALVADRVLGPGPTTSAGQLAIAPVMTRAAPLSAFAPAVVAPASAAVGDPPSRIAGVVAASWPVNIRPVLDPQSARTARQEALAVRGPAMTLAVDGAGSVDRQRLAPAERNYALVARSTKSRMASELLLGFMQSAAADATQRTEILPSGHGWRAAWWPFATQQEAERARATLAARGMDVEVVAF